MYFVILLASLTEILDLDIAEGLPLIKVREQDDDAFELPAPPNALAGTTKIFDSLRLSCMLYSSVIFILLYHLPS